MRLTRKHQMVVAVAAGICGALSGVPAHAGITTVDFTSVGGTSTRHAGSYTGVATYDDITKQLTIDLTNTSAKGFLRGLAFDIAGDSAARYVDGDDKSTKGDEDVFDNATGKKKKPHAVKAKPVGKFEAGAAIDGKVKANKHSKRGIGVGDHESFTFDVSGNNAGSLDVNSFFSADAVFLASFGGFDRRHVDLVTGRVLPAQNPSNNSPTDSTTIDVPTNNNGNNSNPGDTNPIDNSGGNSTAPGGDGNTHLPTDGGNGNGNGNGPTAIPLPPAALAGASTIALAGLGGIRRRLGGRGRA